MARYFIELAYKGTNFSGFQRQDTGNTIQAEVEKALQILHRRPFSLTGSSRTDAGVHALQNYFHFDDELGLNPQLLYKINAILPRDIVVKRIFPVADDAHCRFHAISREYLYYIYRRKDPFLADRAYFFPYTLDFQKLQEAADVLKGTADFQSFSKRNTQVHTFICTIFHSEWREKENGVLVYNVKGNRFLRGMVRGLVGTMLQVGRGKMTIDQFREVIAAKDCTRADFSTPPHGLFLAEVAFPQ